MRNPMFEAGAKALRDTANKIEYMRPEMGSQINVSEYRTGKYDGMTIAAAYMRQIATDLESVGKDET